MRKLKLTVKGGRVCGVKEGEGGRRPEPTDTAAEESGVRPVIY